METGDYFANEDKASLVLSLVKNGTPILIAGKAVFGSVNAYYKGASVEERESIAMARIAYKKQKLPAPLAFRRMSVKMPESRAVRLAELAKKKGVSIYKIVNQILAEKLANYEL